MLLNFKNQLNMKKVIVSFFVCFLVLSCSQNDLVTHKTNKGFSISFSNKDWRLEDSKEILLLFSKNQTEPDFKNNINILVQDLSMQPMSLNEYHQLTLDQIEQATGGNNVESENNVTLSGHPAKELVYHIPQDINRGNLIELKIKQVYLIKNNKAYLITYTSKLNEFNDYLTSAEKVFNTFAIN